MGKFPFACLMTAAALLPQLTAMMVDCCPDDEAEDSQLQAMALMRFLQTKRYSLTRLRLFTRLSHILTREAVAHILFNMSSLTQLELLCGVDNWIESTERVVTEGPIQVRLKTFGLHINSRLHSLSMQLAPTLALSALSSLTSLTLAGVSLDQSIGEVGTPPRCLLQSLRHLYLQGVHKFSNHSLYNLGLHAPALVSLQFSSPPALQVLLIDAEALTSSFPTLRSLTIVDYVLTPTGSWWQGLSGISALHHITLQVLVEQFIVPRVLAEAFRSPTILPRLKFLHMQMRWSDVSRLWNPAADREMMMREWVEAQTAIRCVRPHTRTIMQMDKNDPVPEHMWYTLDP